MLEHIDKIIQDAGPLDWTRNRETYRTVSRILAEIASTDGLVEGAVREVTATARTGCESYDKMDKLVLWMSADRSTRLRLHIFFPGYFDRPHNHRWSFVSRILSGEYLHCVYGSESEVLAQSGAPQARYSHAMGPGADYHLEHSLVHSLSTDMTTFSLVLRGPSVKDNYFTLDTASNNVQWSAGADQESASVRRAKAMTDDAVDRVLATLSQLRILS